MNRPAIFCACRAGMTFLLVLFGLFLISGSRAVGQQSAPATTRAATSTAPAEKLPHQVYVGVYVNQIRAIDLKTNSFVIDFWVWFRWKGESIKPLDSFEIINGHIDSKENEFHDVVKGFNYASARCTATVSKNFDIRRFPLDSHTLSLDIEDGEMETERFIYIADIANTGMSPDLAIPGWQFSAGKTDVVEQGYSTNYGNISLESGNKSVFSRFTYKIDIVRPGMGFYFKLFWSLFLATIIAMLAMLIDPIDLDPRFGLGLGAIFAAIASAYVISSSLPETNQYTLADKLNMLAVGIIFASIVQSVFSLKLWKSGNEAKSKMFDMVCFWGMLTIYGVGCLVITLG